ncbi:MAG: hypothetical protein MZW92_66700 [Comamonadaceae bacterium]|nr:hypothetical protein [Comamonadaceae bacterium]
MAQVDWAIAFGRACFALPARFLRLETLKFQRPMSPGTEVLLTLERREGSGALNFRYESNDGLHASGRVVFGDADA